MNLWVTLSPDQTLYLVRLEVSPGVAYWLGLALYLGSSLAAGWVGSRLLAMAGRISGAKR